MATQTEEAKPVWLGCKEAAKYIDKSPITLQQRLKHKIGFSKPGKDLMFKVSDLDAYLMKHYTPAKE